MSGRAQAPQDEDEAGFALAEVLVAFAILALVTLAMMRAFAGSAAGLGTVSRLDARLDLAARVVEERRAEDPVRPGRLGGEADGLVWWSLVEPVTGAGTPPPPRAPRLFRLTVGAGLKGAALPPPLLRTLLLARGPDA